MEIVNDETINTDIHKHVHVHTRTYFVKLKSSDNYNYRYIGVKSTCLYSLTKYNKFFH